MDRMFADRVETGDRTVPAAQRVGFRAVSFGGGNAVFEMEAEGRHGDPMGTVHGDLLCTPADSATGFAFASTLGPGESTTTLEIATNHIRPIFAGRLLGAARVAHRGMIVGLLERDVEYAERKFAARAACTCQVLRGEVASGR